MHGVGFDLPVHEWFHPQPKGMDLPQTTIAPDFMLKHAEAPEEMYTSSSARMLWIGEMPIVSLNTDSKKKMKRGDLKLRFEGQSASQVISLEKEKAEWLISALKKASIEEKTSLTYGELKADYEAHFPEFELFWHAKPMQDVREMGWLRL